MKITEQNIDQLTPHIMEILDNWKLSSKQIMHVLALEGIAPLRDLRKFQKNLKGLPFSEDLAERLDHILGITDAMRTSYPFNAEIIATWLRQPHRRFAKTTPLDVIMKEDIAGLIKVRVELDCAYGWALFEEKFREKSRS